MYRLIKKIQRLQNRAAKITGSARMDSSTEERNELKWLKVMNGQAPNYLANRFNLKDAGYTVRGYKKLSIPKPRTESKKRFFSYCGATLWNKFVQFFPIQEENIQVNLSDCHPTLFSVYIT